MIFANDILDLRIRFETHGFIHLKNLIPNHVVSRVAQAFDSASERLHPEWKKSVVSGQKDPRYFDIPRILDQDDAFIDLVDLPALFPFLVSIVGDDIQLNQTIARLFYPGTTYTSPFHSDLAHIKGIDLTRNFNLLVKVHFFFEDLEKDQGCLAFIPGSHIYPANYVGPKNLDPNSDTVVRTVPKAGDVVIFNTHTLHMAQDNKTQKVRKSIIYAYSHYWVKQYASAIPHNITRFENSKQRKQLFGVDDPDVPFFDRRLGPNSESNALDSLRSAGKKIARHILPAKIRF